MDVWGWLLAYVVGFALLQLLLYRYFSRERATSGQTPDGLETTEGRPAPTQDPLSAASAGAGRDAVHCQHCGARNERAGPYTFCRRCVKPLR